jgi:hypothetical protein
MFFETHSADAILQTSGFIVAAIITVAPKVIEMINRSASGNPGCDVTPEEPIVSMADKLTSMKTEIGKIRKSRRLITSFSFCFGLFLLVASGYISDGTLTTRNVANLLMGAAFFVIGLREMFEDCRAVERSAMKNAEEGNRLLSSMRKE